MFGVKLFQECLGAFVVLNLFETVIYFELLQLPLFCCFRGNAEKKMLFYPKELRVSID